VGRLPVITALDDLDEESLVRIMTEPRNALIKQYQYLFRIDGIDLQFEREALIAVAKKTLEAKTGARGLRSIIEGILQAPMYDTPSDETVLKVRITKATVDGGEAEIIRK
jgi:ATP-dependent Clp protease ATP-binding subunit ClpX